MTAVSSLPRGAALAALAMALLFLPDCCLLGRHAYGAHMAVFGPVCRAALTGE